MRLTEVELEPSEQKPMLRIAPAAASLIWLGSIALATAIYMEWLPARSLFENEAPEPPAPPARATDDSTDETPVSSPRPRAPGTALSLEATAAPVDVRAPEPRADAPPAGAAAGNVDRPLHAPISTPVVVPESTRTIRGSYYSDDSNWAAGW
ncbi:MAG TPA: hypothetical protein VFU02_18250 [Polyangiaceae bacterium]|nr:hypothetical protein [Polyangiaceae bacterium]